MYLLNDRGGWERRGGKACPATEQFGYNHRGARHKRDGFIQHGACWGPWQMVRPGMVDKGHIMKDRLRHLNFIGVKNY